MIKASALYLVVVISLVIAIILSSLITTGYFYRLEYQKNLRFLRLDNNLHSAITLVTSRDFKTDSVPQLLDLFLNQNDSIWIRKEWWGIYELGAVKSYQQGDTLKKTFFIGAVPGDEQALYLSDENRPLSISGEARIVGDAMLPQSGIRQAYVEGKPYTGKELVQGKIGDSNKDLPELQPELLAQLRKLYYMSQRQTSSLQDSMVHSFFSDTRIIYLGKEKRVLENCHASGRICFISDTILTIKPTASFENVMVLAPAIIIEKGFKGNGQFFGRDSVITGEDCAFTYPSCLAVCNFSESLGQPKVSLGARSILNGIAFSYRQKKTELQTQISLGRSALVKGEVYASGFIKLEKPAEIDGKATCRRFIIQTPATLYENYLFDITLNRKKLSDYYLSSRLLNNNSSFNILKWLQ